MSIGAVGTRRWLAGASAIVLAGCSGSSHEAASTSSATSGAPASGEPPPGEAPPALRAIAGRVLIAGDLPGLARHGPRTLGINANSWVAEEGLPQYERAKEVRRLEALGFVRAVRERLVPAAENGPEAISLVAQFRSVHAALEDVAAEAKVGEAHGAPPFAAPTIPGARGFGGASGVTTGYNVAFAVGPYYYLVGVGYATGTPRAPTRAKRRKTSPPATASKTGASGRVRTADPRLRRPLLYPAEL